MMNKEIKAEWVKKLRSGEYRQGWNALRRGDTYCCLGVLCDIAHQHGVGKWKERVWEDKVSTWEVVTRTTWEFVTKTESVINLLPEAVYVWAGLDRDDPAVTLEARKMPRRHPYERDKNRFALSMLNDNGLTFDEIASLIEEQL